MAAYGRLDVYWPDGPIESFPLEKPTVALGRSPGNDIMLDTTAVSRYHVSFTLQGDQVLLEDLESVNGTYIDGVLMKSHAPHSLRDGEEIQIGDLRIVFHPSDDGQPRVPDLPDLVELQPIEEDAPTFKVEVDDSEQAVTPGAHSQMQVNVQNIGTQTDRYFVEVEGLPKEWVRLDRAEMELPPNVRSQVVLSFKPARRSDSKPGDYTLKIRVTSRTNPTESVGVPILLHLLSFGGFGIVMASARTEAGKPFEVYTHNQGSAPLPLEFSGADRGNLFAYDIQPPTVTLAPGERRTVRGQVRPKQRRMFGSPREHRFDIIARARDASRFQAAVSGVYVEQPGLPPWLPALALPVAVALIFLALAAGALILLPGFTATATPTRTVQPTELPATPTVLIIVPTVTAPPTFIFPTLTEPPLTFSPTLTEAPPPTFSPTPTLEPF